MEYGINNTPTIEALIKYLNENNHKADDKKDLDKKIKYVLSSMDLIYSYSFENNKELMLFLLIMTIKYHCLAIEDYDTAYKLWREKIDAIYTNYLGSGNGEISEFMTTLMEMELICAYKLQSLADPLKQILKRIDIRGIKVPEHHSLYTNFIFSGAHLEAYGYFIRRLLETEPLKHAEIIGYICPFFSVCLSNFNSHKDIIYLNGINHVGEGLRHTNISPLIIKINCFYSVLFSVLYDKEILHKIPDGKDDNNTDMIHSGDDYSEKDVHLNFISIFEELNESSCSEYEDVLLNIIHDYIKSSYSFFHIAFLDTISKFRDQKIYCLKTKLLDQYLYKKGLSLIESSFERDDFETVTGIYKTMSDKARVMSLSKYSMEIAYSMRAVGDRDGAKKAYEYAMNTGVRNVELYNNLANIYIEENNYNKALFLYNMALSLDPENRTIRGGKDKTEKEIRRQQEREERIIDIFLNKTKSSHKTIIFTVYRYPGNSITHEFLSKITGENIEAVKDELAFLIGNNLLTPAGEDIYTLDSSVKNALEKSLISSSHNHNMLKLHKPLLYPDYRIKLYLLLTELFPGYGVFPSISLKSILNASLLKDFFDIKTINNLLAVILDFCIVNTSTYIPILAFDASLKNDENHDSEMDYETKKALLGLLGLPLVGLFIDDNRDIEHLKAAVNNSIKDLIIEIKSCPSFYDSSLLKEIDTTKFGIFYSPVDMNVIQKEWQLLVGPGIAEKSRIHSLEGDILSIEVSGDLKPIIQMSENIINNSILNKFLFLKKICYIWK